MPQTLTRGDMLSTSGGPPPIRSAIGPGNLARMSSSCIDVVVLRTATALFGRGCIGAKAVAESTISESIMPTTHGGRKTPFGCEMVEMRGLHLARRLYPIGVPLKKDSRVSVECVRMGSFRFWLRNKRSEASFLSNENYRT